MRLLKIDGYGLDECNYIDFLYWLLPVWQIQGVTKKMYHQLGVPHKIYKSPNNPFEGDGWYQCVVLKVFNSKDIQVIFPSLEEAKKFEEGLVKILLEEDKPEVITI